MVTLLPSETKEMVFLIILLAIALFGNAALVYYLSRLDRRNGNHEKPGSQGGELH